MGAEYAVPAIIASGATRSGAPHEADVERVAASDRHDRTREPAGELHEDTPTSARSEGCLLTTAPTVRTSPRRRFLGPPRRRSESRGTRTVVDPVRGGGRRRRRLASER